MGGHSMLTENFLFIYSQEYESICKDVLKSMSLDCDDQWLKFSQAFT